MKIFKKLLTYFFRGMLVSLPLALTAFLVISVVRWLDKVFSLEVFVLLLVGITLVGFLTSNLIYRSIFDALDKVVRKIPLVSLIYTSIKDLISAFMGEKKKFSKPVMVRLNQENQLFRLGFITEEDLSSLGILDKVAVYLPHSYNISGNLYIVPKENVVALEVAGPEIMKFIVSGGVTDMQTP